MTVNYLVLLVGVVFLASGILLLKKEMKNRKCNTASGMAEVVSYSVEEHNTAGADHVGTSYVYYPIMRYCVSDQWYEKKDSIGRGKQKYEIGERVEILYDPEHPEEFCIAGDKTGLIMAIICFAIGIGVCILAFFAD